MPRAARLLGLVLACLLSACTAAPLVEQEVTSPSRTTNSSRSNDTLVSSSSSSSVPEESTPVFVTSTVASSSSAEPPQSSTFVLDTTEQEQLTSSLQPPVEDVFDSDEAIRHLPGYWIKRPGEDEDQEHEGVASFIDYRTELYQIADLFATEPMLAVEEAEKHHDPAVCSDSSSINSSSESSTGTV